MLQEISIKNFAIIEEVTLSFDSGMTILTGETGAGKSIIIDAMTLLLGGRSSSDFVRKGAKKATIEGLFSAGKSKILSKLLEENGFEAANELVLRREIFAEGRSVCRINGQLVNLNLLRRVGDTLVDIHGQHDNQDLMDAKQHLDLLDAFGDEAFNQLKGRYSEVFFDYRKIRSNLTKRRENEALYAQRIDILTYQINEIEEANIDLEEDAALFDKREKMTHLKEIADHLSNAYLALNAEENSNLDAVQMAHGSLEAVASFGSSYAALAEKAGEAYYLLEDVADNLEKELENLEFDPRELTQLEERIFLLNALKKKYGPELADVLLFLENCQKELSNLTGQETDTETLEAQLKEKQETLLNFAEQLAKARKRLAEDLTTDIKQELSDLYMEKADFRVVFENGKYSDHGNQKVEFYIQTNPGEGFKPLAKTASGGELSRLMLAIKSSFARRENKTAIVFDEVDTGVSGRVAQAIAQKIYKIARSGQVLAISHLPQVVAIADQQFYIEKTSDNGVTTSTVRLLNQKERIEEIARMLSGNQVSEEAIASAKQLIKKSV